jgi:hypothetical protein
LTAIESFQDKYIKGQEEHHRRTTFVEGYRKLLEEERLNSTNGTCSEGGRSPAPTGQARVFRFLSVGCTHGYSRLAPSGQLAAVRHVTQSDEAMRQFRSTMSSYFCVTAKQTGPHKASRECRSFPRRWQILRAAALIIILAAFLTSARAAPSSGGYPRQDLIRALKRLEKKLGFRRTKNFSHVTERSVAAYRCYYTGKLELPDSYVGLHLKQGAKDGCTLDPEKYDVFFYPIEAVGNGKTPVTTSLRRDSMERFLAVAAHEDFHATAGKLPATITEPAATQVGLLTASELAREKFGADSKVYRNLSIEPELFLRKAELVVRYHANLSKLYAAVQSGEVSQAKALAQKETLFGEMRGECKAITPDAKSFNKCLSANNNAGLAFDMTYAKHYPLIYELYLASGQDLKATVSATKKALAARSEPEAIRRLQNLK